MSDDIPVTDPAVIERFWHNYLSILGKARIHKAAMPWYRKHAEAYINAHQGLRLTAHSPAQVDDYFNAKGRLTELPESLSNYQKGTDLFTPLWNFLYRLFTDYLFPINLRNRAIVASTTGSTADSG